MPEGLITTVRKTIIARRLLCKGERVLIACSGGADSTAMLHVLWRLTREHQLDLHVASVDHGLRAAAQEEIALVRHRCQSLVLPFNLLRVQVTQAPSLQAEARDARYQALRELARRLACQKIAVAHTADDQAETVLIKLLRGGSVLELKGVEAHRSDQVVRPLLDSTRAQVLSYLTHYDLPFACDPSNRDHRFLRTRVREQLLPQLRQYNPQIVSTLTALADDANEIESLVGQHCDSIESQIALGEPRFDTSRLPRNKVLQAELLRRWLTRHIGTAPSQLHVEAILGLRTKRAAVQLPAGYVVSWQKPYWILSQPHGGRGRFVDAKSKLC